MKKIWKKFTEGNYQYGPTLVFAAMLVAFVAWALISGISNVPGTPVGSNDTIDPGEYAGDGSIGWYAPYDVEHLDALDNSEDADYNLEYRMATYNGTKIADGAIVDSNYMAGNGGDSAMLPTPVHSTALADDGTAEGHMEEGPNGPHYVVDRVISPAGGSGHLEEGPNGPQFVEGDD